MAEQETPYAPGWEIFPEDPNVPERPLFVYNDSPLPPDMTVERQRELFDEMITQATKEELQTRRRPTEPLRPQRPAHATFLPSATSAAPPFYNFQDGNAQYFDAVEVKSAKYISVTIRSSLQKLCDLEYDMTKWYNDFYFGNKMYERKNWTRVLIGGFYAAYIPRLDRWVRAWVCDVVYADKLPDYKAGAYEVFMYLIDYGVADMCPRRYLLPLRKEDAVLPFQSYIASIQHKSDAELTPTQVEKLKNEFEGKSFRASVLRTQTLRDLPFQVLVVKLHKTAKN